MSLDVYLTLPGDPLPVAASERIFIREDGGTREVTRAEWDELQPGRVLVAMVAEMDAREVYEANITHNLGRMASQVETDFTIPGGKGTVFTLYDVLWGALDHGLTKAGQLIPIMADALASLRADRARLQEFNPANGWGDYDGLVRFTENYLAACEQWPDADIEVSR